MRGAFQAPFELNTISFINIMLTKKIPKNEEALEYLILKYSRLFDTSQKRRNT